MGLTESRKQTEDGRAAQDHRPNDEPKVHTAVLYPNSRYVSYHSVSKEHFNFLRKIDSTLELNSYEEARTSKIWQAAMKEGLTARLPRGSNRDL